MTGTSFKIFLAAIVAVLQTQAFAPHTASTQVAIGRHGSVLMMAIDRGSRKPPPKKENVLVMNELITIVGEVRVSIVMPGETPDEVIGIMDISEARARAAEEETDLVLLSANSQPPVVKIVDAGKLRYQMELKKKANLKDSGSKDVKEVKLSYNIGVGDYDVRKNRALEFLAKGHRVKVTCQFRGREQQHGESRMM